MKHYYEILLALVVSSKEEEIKELLERIEKIMSAEGATIEEVQRLERKEFAYPHRHLQSGYYVNFMIIAAPTAIDKIRQKLTLVEAVTLQNYYRKGSLPIEGQAVKPAKVIKKRKLVEASA